MYQIISFIILLLITHCSDSTQFNSNSSQETSILIVGKLIFQNEYDPKNVSLKIPSTPFETHPDSLGNYTLSVSLDSIQKSKIDLSITSKYLTVEINKQMLDQIAFEDWNDTVPDLIFTQYNIRGYLYSDSNFSKYVQINVSKNDTLFTSHDIWYDSSNYTYSGFWYTAPISAGDSATIFISVLDSSKTTLFQSDTISINNLTGDIEFPDIIVGELPEIINVTINDLPQVGDTIEASIIYSNTNWNKITIPVYQWYRDNLPLKGANSTHYLVTSSDSGSVLSFSVQTIMGIKDSTRSEAFVANASLPAYKTPQFTGSIEGDVEKVHYIIATITTIDTSVNTPLILSEDNYSYSSDLRRVLDFPFDSASVQISLLDINSKTIQVLNPVSLGRNRGSITIPKTKIGTPPSISNLKLSGVSKNCSQLEVTYDYYDNENDPEGEPIIQWFIDNKELLYSNAISANRRIFSLDENFAGSQISVKVTPIALSGYFLKGITTQSETTDSIESHTYPLIRNVKITREFPSSPILKANFDFYAPEGDSLLGVRYYWHVGGDIIRGDSAYEVLPENNIGESIMVDITAWSLTPYGGSCKSNQQTASIYIFTSTSNVEAHNVFISGDIIPGNTLIGQYEYFHHQGIPEGASQFEWYCDDVLIPNAQSKSYTITNSDTCTITFKITPYSTDLIHNKGLEQQANLPFYSQVTDERDGQVYKSTMIAGRTWLTQNLNYSGDDSHGNRTFELGECQGTKIPVDSDLCSITGRTYSSNEANGTNSTPQDQELCPHGWHQATASNWFALANSFENYTNASHADILRSDNSFRNLSGFSVIGATSWWTPSYSSRCYSIWDSYSGAGCGGNEFYYISDSIFDVGHEQGIIGGPEYPDRHIRCVKD